MKSKTNKPKCPICNKRVMHRTVRISCYPCFSKMVMDDTWRDFVLSR